jgi:hypothetical protein
MLISYHNDKKLKRTIVTEMKNHQKHDQFIKGSYGKMNGKFRGCAVGCAIDSFNLKLGKKYKKDNHKAFEEAIGVPEWLARVQDCIFEGLPDKKNSQFAVDFLSSIPVGINLEPVKWKFCAFILKENIKRVLTLKISDGLKKQVVDAIRMCLDLNEQAIKTGIWDESAAVSAESAVWSAASEAWNAVWSAERSAAWSALWSAARSAEIAERSAARSAVSAAWSAVWNAEKGAERSVARSAESAASAAESSAEGASWSAASAAYQRYAKELLRLLKDSK